MYAERIILVLDDSGSHVARRPHPDIVGKARVIGDTLDSVPEMDWDLPR